MKIELIPTSLLSEHPLIERLPRWEQDHPEFASLANDIEQHGIIEPLVVVPEADGWHLVDGRHRLMAACRVGLEAVPATIREPEEALEIVLGTLLHRRHYSKSTLAYVCYPLLGDIEKAGAGRPKKLSDDPTIKTDDAIAQRLGVGRELVIFARKAHATFASRPDLREKFEPAILAGELSLNRLPGAIAGRDSTIGKHRSNPAPEKLLQEGFKSLNHRFSAWERIHPETRHELTHQFVDTVLALPDEVKRTLGSALQATNA